MGLLSYFLGIELSRLSNGDIIPNQSKYVKELLVKTNMDQARHIAFPMTTCFTLLVHIGDVFDNPSYYRSVVGPLQYIIRPSLTYVVNKVGLFMSRLLNLHWLAMKMILRYLKGKMTHGLVDFILILGVALVSHEVVSSLDFGKISILFRSN